jgi:ribosomal silencing factor RsfS
MQARLSRVFRILRFFSETQTTPPPDPVKTSEVPTVVLNDSILATRPAKGVLWGQGEVFLKYQKVKFKKGKIPSLRRLQKFLEHEQGRDVIVMDIKQYSKNTLFNTLMICSGVTPRHISRMAYSLLKALKNAEIPESDMFQVLGTRDSGWMMLTMKDLYIYLLTEEVRAEIDIENFWKNPMPKKEIEEFRLDEFEMYKRFKKKR